MSNSAQTALPRSSASAPPTTCLSFCWQTGEQGPELVIDLPEAQSDGGSAVIARVVSNPRPDCFQYWIVQLCYRQAVILERNYRCQTDAYNPIANLKFTWSMHNAAGHVKRELRRLVKAQNHSDRARRAAQAANVRLAGK